MSSRARDELSGRSALVTGAGRGIGRAIATELAARGARVLLAGRREAPLRATAEEIEALGGTTAILAGDLREAALHARLAREHPELDVLVHSAAAFAPYAPLEEVPDAAIDEVLATNVRAFLALLKLALPGMKGRGFGRVVAIGSIAAEHGAEGQVAYAAAKSALRGLIKSVAAESARFGVTANLVEPGLVATERIAESVDVSWQRRLLANTAAQRRGRPEEIAAVVGFLCSHAASYLNGAVIPASGGFGLGLYARELPGPGLGEA
jgi:NAD(P)-dependent dehydrogenase (short-subunit alcohol dehydrogenase family)